MEKGYYTKKEIYSQPKAWANAFIVLKSIKQEVKDLEPKKHFGQIIFTGCGSTYYLAIAAAALTREMTGQSAIALPASELWLYPGTSYTSKENLLVAVSRSGETTETLRACEAFHTDKRGSLLTLSCYGDMPLAKMGDMNIVLPSGQENSVAQTRAFSTLYLATTALACIWSGLDESFDSLKRLPDAGQKLMDNYSNLATELGRDAALDRFYWLGSGVRYGLASELSLKMKEMSLSHSEPFHFMEFRHGPKSMITSTSLTIGLRSTLNAEKESAVLADIRELGGRTIEIGESLAQVAFESGVSEAVQNILYLPFGQILAFERSLSKGLNPDRPTNLDTVVILN